MDGIVPIGNISLDSDEAIPQNRWDALVPPRIAHLREHMEVHGGKYASDGRIGDKGKSSDNERPSERGAMDDIWRDELDKSSFVHVNQEREEVTRYEWVVAMHAREQARSMEEEKR